MQVGPRENCWYIQHERVVVVVAVTWRTVVDIESKGDGVGVKFTSHTVETT